MPLAVSLEAAGTGLDRYLVQALESGKRTTMQVYDSLSGLVGNTPLVRL
jgi:hypothetical protein